jgi:hypothetical protein
MKFLQPPTSYILRIFIYLFTYFTGMIGQLMVDAEFETSLAISCTVLKMGNFVTCNFMAT